MSISPIKIAFELKEGPLVQHYNFLHAFFFAVILGLIGALLNSYPIELAYNISLVIGNLVFVVAAAYFRPPLALLTALIATTPLFFIWGHPYGYITFGLEAIFVSFLRGRGWYLPTADLLYWLVIGMPLTALMIWYNNTSAQDYLLFSIFKQSINAIFYTSLAVIVILLFGDSIKNTLSQQPPLIKNLRQYLHHILWIMSAFFVVGVCLLLSRNLSLVQHQLFEQELETNSKYISRIVENYVDEHTTAVRLIAGHLSSVSKEQYSQILIKNHTALPGFITMLIADSQADVHFASPLSLLENAPDKVLNISDRPYFSHAFFQQELFVSSVFLGRGFGADPIIAISAPIYKNQGEQPVGIVEGSLNLSMFEHINRNNDQDIAQIKVVITDNNNNIIFTDADLALETLSEFKFSLGEKRKDHNLLIIEGNNDSSEPYIFREIKLNNGWKVYSLSEHSQLLRLIEQQYLTIFISLFVIFALVVILANRFATILNRPLAFAIQELTNNEKSHLAKDMASDAPQEFITLYQELQQGKRHLLKQQQVLEETVIERTKDLHKANQALKNLADTDSLTGLSNRRHLNIRFKELQAILSRNEHTQMVVAILDLDHFKRLNDTYGHLAGDKCLIEVSDIIATKFDRRSDIVSRFGGEEFVVVTQNDASNKVLDKFEQLRADIEKHNFSVNDDQDVSVTISIGLVVSEAIYSDEFEVWLKVADEFLYQAKENGRNKVCSQQIK